MEPPAVSRHHAMTLLLSVQRRKRRFLPLRDKRSYRRIRAITLALPLRERTHAHTPVRTTPPEFLPSNALYARIRGSAGPLPVQRAHERNHSALAGVL